MAEVEIQSASSEYLGALKSVRLAKTFAWLVIFLALAIQGTFFVLAICTNALETPQEASAAARTVTSAPAHAAASMTSSAPAIFGVDLRHLAGWLLPVTKLAGFLAALALMVLLLAATQISLAGGLGGVQGFSSAFVWSIVLLLTLVPWQQVLGGLLGAGVLAGFSELQAAAAQAKPNWGNSSSVPFVAYLCRFFAYPFVVMLVWIILGLRFAQGMRKVGESTTVVPPERR